jgi:hypothetical protein
MGAGSICSNLKSDGSNIVIRAASPIDTGLRKIGGILADGADVGCSCVLNPGTVIGGGFSVGGNSLGKTQPRRASYVSSTSSSAERISDERNVDNVILVDLDSYESIVEKSADTTIYPASMTKVMSLLVACENMKSLNTKLKVAKKYVDYAYNVGGSLFGIKQGDELDTQDLLYLTSYYSDTVAVLMLADHIAGSEENFVKLMKTRETSSLIGT